MISVGHQILNIISDSGGLPRQNFN